MIILSKSGQWNGMLVFTSMKLILLHPINKTTPNMVNTTLENKEGLHSFLNIGNQQYILIAINVVM